MVVFTFLAAISYPYTACRLIARAWKQAHFIETQGLGHRGALQSKSIHEQVLNFLKAA